MVQIRYGKHVFRIDSIRSIEVLANQWSSEPVDILSTNMSVIPISSCLCYCKLVDECTTRLDWTLCDHGRSIGICCIPLVESMEMNSRSLINQVICYRDLDNVPGVDSDSWARPLSINANERSSKTVRRGRYPANAPSIRS